MTPEDPFDAWRRRAFKESGIPPELFADFEREFARMQGLVNKVLEDAMRHAASPQRHEPFVYGFSMRIGKDGTPQLHPFGSAMPFTATATEGPESREPLTDVVEGDAEIAVTVELPGVEKQDIHLHVAEEAVTVKADKARRYHKQIRLPAKVIPSSAKATFKNGVLDVTLTKAAEPNPGHRVRIE